MSDASMTPGRSGPDRRAVGGAASAPGAGVDGVLRIPGVGPGVESVGLARELSRPGLSPLRARIKAIASSHPVVSPQGYVQRFDPSMGIDAKEAKNFPTILSELRRGETIGEMFLRKTGKPFLGTLDGPAAFGKSEQAKRLAHFLGVEDVSSGSLYRAVALAAERLIPSIAERPWSVRRREFSERGTPLLAQGEQDRLLEITGALTRGGGQGFEFDHSFETTRIKLEIGTGTKQASGFEDVTEDLQSSECSAGASIVSELQEVRDLLRPVFKKLGAKGWVVDGRDMGLVVFPEATIKFYFSDPIGQNNVSVMTRAHWRVMQRLGTGDIGFLKSYLRQKDVCLEDASRMSLEEVDVLLKGFLSEEGGLSSRTLSRLDCDGMEKLLIKMLVEREAAAVIERDIADASRAVSPMRPAPDAIMFSPVFASHDEAKPRAVSFREAKRSKGVRPASQPLVTALSMNEAFDKLCEMTLTRIEEILKAKSH